MSNKFGGYATDTHCKKPLLAWTVGINDNGKKQIVVTGYDELPYLRYNGRLYYDRQEIPCGHCISCRLRYSKEWANRMMLEAKEHESNYFLTLTYDDEHLPPSNMIYDDDGVELFESPRHPLVKRDVQLFMKSLRKKFSDQRIRFYACGEYGSKNHRPHYHIILFGLKLPDDDLQVPKGLRSQNELGQKYFVSKSISQVWDKGIHIVTDVSWETCAYTARYVTKKLNGDESQLYRDFNIPKEFALMSRKPGIAYNYYQEHKDFIYDTDELFLSLGIKGGRKVKPPKYYDRLYDIDYPDEMSIIKDRRAQKAVDASKLNSRATSLSYEEQLSKQELSLKQRTSVLKRERGF